MSTRPVAIVLSVFATALLLLPGPSSATARNATRKTPPGVVVEGVAKASAGEKAGLQPGDVILSWSRAAAPPDNPSAAGRGLLSPFELLDVELEQAPRGPVTLVGQRESQPMSWALPLGRWQLSLRPALPTDLLELHNEARDLLDAKKIPDAAERWRAGAAAARREGARLSALWFLAKEVRALTDARLWTETDVTYSQAVEEAKQAGETAVAARLLRDWAEVFRGRGEPDRAEDCYRRAMEELRTLGSESLLIAACLNNLGLVKTSAGDLTAAEDLHRRSLELAERLAPRSQRVAQNFNNLGAVMYAKGDLPAAEGHFQRALEIHQSLDPGSLDVSETLGNVGLVLVDRGDLAAAEGYLRRALHIVEGIEPEGWSCANILHNLGSLARDRGDLAGADTFYRRALALDEKGGSAGIDVAKTLNNMGGIAADRGDLDAATDYFQRALEIAEKTAPGGLVAAGLLNNLGGLSLERHDPARAEEYVRKGLELREKQAPESLDVSHSLRSLGDVCSERGDHAKAESYLARALAIQERLAPESLDVSRSLESLAQAIRGQEDPTRAEEPAQRSLAIVRRLAPGSADEADSLNELGLVYRAANKPGAADTLCQAVDALERQKAKLGGTEETKSTFAAKYAGYYRDCLEALVKKGQAVEAFRVLERSRARSLLSMLAERDLLFASDVPAELARERRLTDAEYDRTQGELAKLNAAKDAEEIEALLGRLREVRAKQDEIAASIRKASPRFASLQYPEPLGLDAARAALQPGTLLLSYSVGEEQTLLFAVQSSNQSKPKAPGLTVLPIPVGEEVLREKVERFRTLIQTRDAASLKMLKAQAAELYDVLVKPAERLIASSQRVLISPDGPLHTLPFGALQRKRRYLAEWKPLHQVVSATVYAELTRPREGGRSGSTKLTAFGDPQYPVTLQKESDTVADATVRSVVRGGFAFDPLPSSRAEVEGIGRLYPEEASLYLGADATEERVKATGRDVRYVHFATHGLLNERFPLDSSLVLTIPEQLAEGRDNGLLQAWEVLEKVRIDADLVVLSACETGLGKEMGGEGLVGLTRAFQYAGARSILASLWSVSDESTADLMRRFYTYLKAGKSKDGALRDAQVDLIQGPTASHPFHWAAFQLVGDWR